MPAAEENTYYVFNTYLTKVAEGCCNAAASPVRPLLLASHIGNDPMAPGYVIALVLIGAGSALFVIGLLLVRQEARERAENLKTFLKTGVAPAAPAPAGNAPKITPRQPAKILQLHVPRTSQAEAAHALRRAYYSSRVRSAA